MKASNSGANDHFGQSVALSGVLPVDGTSVRSATLVVGAPGEDSSATGVNGDGSINTTLGVESGAAYVFSVGLTLGQLAYLKANNTDARDVFGSSVAASGELIVVGAPHESSSARGVNGRQEDNTSAASGAAYVFSNKAGNVSFSAYLKATNTGPQDLFGTSVSISTDTIAVGAPGEDSNARGIGGNQLDNSLSNAGAAYTFAITDGTWIPQAYFKGNPPGAQDGFGKSVAVSQGTVVVAAAGEDRAAIGVNDPGSPADAADGSGAVCVFR